MERCRSSHTSASTYHEPLDKYFCPPYAILSRNLTEKQYRGMRFHKTLTVLLIDLPFRVRLGIVVLAYLLCLALFALVFLPSHNGSILAIPLALFVMNSLSVGGIWWPPSLLLTFLSGSLALLVEAVLIGLARHTFALAQARDLAQAAQRKAQRAEQQLALAYQHQRQLNDLKDQFILNVSHELRTPLTQVYGYLELLETYHNTLTNDKQVEYIRKATRGC